MLAIAYKAPNLDRKISDLKRRGEIFTQNKPKSGNRSDEDNFARLILEFAKRAFLGLCFDCFSPSISEINSS